MKIGIVGLGLIGGSILKAIKARTNHLCYGYNRSKNTLIQAQAFLDGVLDTITIQDMDVIFLCVAPTVAVNYLKDNIDYIKRGTIVIDVCGVKEYIIKSVEDLCLEKGINFIGGHPMAGKEVSGFDNSSAEMFDNANFIITPTKKSNQNAILIVEELLLSIGFANVIKATSQKHDKIIAYTSQLAHLVSNAYIKSPTLAYYRGFSGGSFEDLTRVARLDSKIWTELFLLNKENLLYELDILLSNLLAYKDALNDNDEERLSKLLEQGNQLKINS